MYPNGVASPGPAQPLPMPGQHRIRNSNTNGQGNRPLPGFVISGIEPPTPRRGPRRDHPGSRHESAAPGLGLVGTAQRQSGGRHALAAEEAVGKLHPRVATHMKRLQPPCSVPSSPSRPCKSQSLPTNGFAGCCRAVFRELFARTQTGGSRVRWPHAAPIWRPQSPAPRIAMF